MTIQFLCREHNSEKYRGFPRAFQKRGIRVEGVDDGTPLDVDLHRLIDRCEERPMLVLQLESNFPLLPRGLTQVDIPTLCVQSDTYAYTRHRIRWSMLFDYAVVQHPGFEDQFRRAGHPRPLTLYHAVERDLFVAADVERVFEVGWVGYMVGAPYKRRQRLIPMLEGQFRMNDWRRIHTLDELAEVYKRSKIVVNIARDDYPSDANLRAFEAMAGGALLITQCPTELAAIGFEEGVHFIGYREEQEVPQLVRRYLEDKPARRRVAEAGRDKVLREHTYDSRVEAILRMLQQDRGRQFSPARKWPEASVRLLRLEYYAAHSRLEYACQELREIARLSLPDALAGMPTIARAWARQSRSWVLGKVLQGL
jgi:hypothetical protein